MARLRPGRAWVALVVLAGLQVGTAQAGFAILWDGTVRSYYFTTSDYDNFTDGPGDVFCPGAGWAAVAQSSGGGAWVVCGYNSRANAENTAFDGCNRNYGGCYVAWSGYDDDHRNTGSDYMYNLRDFISY
jgi:hypothetical protein